MLFHSCRILKKSFHIQNQDHFFLLVGTLNTSTTTTSTKLDLVPGLICLEIEVGKH